MKETKLLPAGRGEPATTKSQQSEHSERLKRTIFRRLDLKIRHRKWLRKLRNATSVTRELKERYNIYNFRIGMMQLLNFISYGKNRFVYGLYYLYFEKGIRHVSNSFTWHFY